jgi:hypothetical protein
MVKDAVIDRCVKEYVNGSGVHDIRWKTAVEMHGSGYK